MSKSIFISHAEKDKALAELLVNLIEDGIGVPEQEIFCSSLNGYGIPTGKNFTDYIKSQIDVPKVVIFLLTQNYYNSYFCLCEMGAAWVKSHQLFPILVPPLDYEDLKAVLIGTKVAKIDDKNKYIELRDLLKKEIDFIAKSDAKWERKREEFFNKLSDVLTSINNQCEKISNVNTEQEHQNDLGEIERFILITIANNESICKKDLQELILKNMNIHYQKTEYYINELGINKYVYMDYEHYPFHLTQKGREYLINNNLI